jgi:hypothetical protein
MKAFVVLSFAQIALSAFCINGQYDYSCQVDQQYYTYTVQSFSNVVGENLVIKNIKDVKVGDLVKSHDNYYTQVIETSETQIYNPQMYYHDNTINNAGNYSTAVSNIDYLHGGNFATKTFTDEKPYILNSTYYYDYDSRHSDFQFGIHQYNHMEDPLITTTYSHECSYIHYYPRGTDIVNMAALAEAVNNTSMLNCAYANSSITISSCDAIGVKTASGFITVNGILFKLN